MQADHSILHDHQMDVRRSLTGTMPYGSEHLAVSTFRSDGESLSGRGRAASAPRDSRPSSPPPATRNLRDKLLALLWSEGEPDKSRHALTQSLYHIRKALGVERIF